MTTIMNDVRLVFQTVGEKQVNMDEIIKRLGKSNPARYNRKGLTEDNIRDALKHYENLNVIYIDSQENNVVLI